MSQSRSGRTASAALVLALVAALVVWLRSRARPIQVDDPPEWPPMPPAPPEPPVDDAAPVVATGSGAVWRAPNPDGSCPEGFPIKVKESSGIFHVPDGRVYDRTNADRCYADTASAIADGYRQSKM